MMASGEGNNEGMKIRELEPLGGKMRQTVQRHDGPMTEKFSWWMHSTMWMFFHLRIVF